MQLLRSPVGRKRSRQRNVRSMTITAPVAGWDAKSPLASMNPTSAVSLRNWFPQPGWVEVRRGYRVHAFNIGSDLITVTSADAGTNLLTSVSHGLSNGTEVRIYVPIASTIPAGLSADETYYVVSSVNDTFALSTTLGGSAVDITSAGSGSFFVYQLSEPAIETLAVWQGPNGSAMFAVAGGAVWSVGSSESATLSRSGVSENAWQWCQHTTSAGSFLFMVNGTDAPLHYNGTTWTAPTITGVTPADAIHVISHKKRLWFVLRDSTKGAYLGTEAVAGAASTFEFGSLFTRGGHLLALATWTRDGGSGADDYLVAVSSRGQVAVYQGTDPSSATTWGLVGVFDVPTPIGRRCFSRYGADLLLITLEGVFPLSQLLSVDQSQAGRVSITDAISPEFNTAARSYGSNWGWEVVVYPKGTRLIVNVPTAEQQTAKQYVQNTMTGAWCEFDSHNALCWSVYNDALYFGGPDGIVYQADTGSADLDAPITAVGQAAYSAFGSANIKRFSMIRPLVTVSATNRPSVGLSTDFVETSAMSAISPSSGASTSTWDSAKWDSGVWADTDLEVNDWASAVSIGTFGSVKFQAQTGVSVGGGGAWGVGLWGDMLWGSRGRSEETMRIQGFVLLYESGEYI